MSSPAADDGDNGGPTGSPRRIPLRLAAAASRESASESSDDGLRMSPAAARRFAWRNLQHASATPDLITSLLRPPSPDALYVAPEVHGRLRRSIASSPSGTACPVDRLFLSWSDCFSAARLIRTQLGSLVKCPYHARGCARELRREAVERHATAECPYRDFACPDAGCDRRVRHMPKDECPHRETKYSRCGASVDEADLDGHLVLSCPKARTRCQGCWQLVCRLQMDAHHDVECDGVEIACPYHDVGCPARTMHGDMSTHSLACVFHPDSPSGVVIRTQRELIQSYDDLGSQLRDMKARKEDTNQRIDQLEAAVDRRGGGDSLIHDNHTMQDLDAGF